MKGYSLKWRLVVSITVIFVLLWSFVFFWLYFDLAKRLQNTLDERLSASAHMVIRLVQQLPLQDIHSALQHETQDINHPNLIACEVSVFSSNIAVEQKIVARTRGAPENLQTQKTGFSTWRYQNTEWRSYVIQKGNIQVVTAEKLQLRHSLLKQILQSVLIPLIATLFLCILLILWIMRVEFRPLQNISNTLIKKKQNLSESALYLIELKSQNTPKEIQPFVDNLFDLIQQLHKSLENEKSFTAFAAHELRSPLTAIKTHVQLSKLMLAQSQMTDHAAFKNLEQAEHSINRYEQLLKQLLLLSQMEAMTLQPFQPVSTDIGQSLKQVMLELESNYPEIRSNLNLTIEIEQTIQIPETELNIILKNLIENAYIHSNSQQTIEIQLIKGKLMIVDHGIGLADNELTLLTQRFWRKSSQNNGHGLGLSLVKLILERYGYSIQFSHNQPQGLKVTIYLDKRL